MQEKRETFLVYLDDNDQKIEAFVDILEQTETYIKFQTNRNIITIPMARVLKIKEPRGEK
jgi:sporulation protein YlmC with PRC-barrel domain